MKPTRPSDEGLFVGPEAEPDRYRLGAVVGAGSEGVLYRGSITTPSGTTLDVAIKMLHPRFHSHIEQWRERWGEQVELLRSLQVPGVVAVRDGFIGAPPHAAHGASSDSRGRTLYLVMNWVDGVRLDEWLEAHPDSSSSERLRLLLPVAAALDLMHAGSATGGVPVVHRDIKPSNVLVTSGGEAVLVDFGLARALPGGSRSTSVSGTLGYMAPEVERSGRFSPASDRYSLGAIALFLLTGSEPPPSVGDGELRRLLSDALPRQPEVVEHIMPMLARNPDRRPVLLANWCAQLRDSSLDGDNPLEALRPLAPTRRPPAPAGGPSRTRPASPRRVPSTRTTAALGIAAAALLVAASVAALTLNHGTVSLTTATRGPTTSTSVSGETTAPPAAGAVVTVAPAVAGLRLCKNTFLGYYVTMPDPLFASEESSVFSPCQAFDTKRMTTSSYTGQAPIAVPIMFGDSAQSREALTKLVVGSMTVTSQRPSAVAGQPATVIEGTVGSAREDDYLVDWAGGRVVLIAQLLLDKTSNQTWQADRQAFDALMQSVKPSAPSDCADSGDVRCGDFYWTSTPVNHPLTAVVTNVSPPNPVVGDEVVFTVHAHDDDADHVDLSSVDFGDGPSSDVQGIAVSSSNCPGSQLASYLRCVRPAPGPSGPWKPPQRRPGDLTVVCHHVYSRAQTFTARFGFTSTADGSDVPAGHDPYGDRGGASQNVSVLLPPNSAAASSSSASTSTSTSTTQPPYVSPATACSTQ